MAHSPLCRPSVKPRGRTVRLFPAISSLTYRHRSSKLLVRWLTKTAPPSHRRYLGTPRAAVQGWQLKDGGNAMLHWKFTLTTPVPSGESVWLIQKIKVTMPGFFGGQQVSESTTYYELIGTIHAGQSQIAGQPFDDTWMSSPPGAQNVELMTPFGNVRIPRQVAAGTIKFEGEVQAFLVTSALSAVLTNLFYDPANNNNSLAWYTGMQPLKPNVGQAEGTPPQVTPGTLLSIKNFNDKLSPSKAGDPFQTPAVNYWQDRAIGAEAINGQWAFETENIQFRDTKITANGVNAWETRYGNQTTGPGTLP